MDDASPDGPREADDFVGREALLRRLRQALDRARDGEPQVMLVTGSAGMGKSRVCDALARMARVSGAEVRLGRGHEGEAEPAYWPWTRMLEPLLEELDDAELRGVLGTQAERVLELVPALRARLGPAASAVRDESEEARFQLFAGITSVLRRLAQRRALVLILDDLHLADRGSTLLLRFVAREFTSGRLLVLATARNDRIEAGSETDLTIAELARRRDAVALPRLTTDEVGRLVALLCGEEARQPLVEAIRDLSHGSPAAVKAILHRLLAERPLSEHDPDSLAALVPQAPAMPGAAPPHTRCAMLDEGEVWTLIYAERSVRLREAKGLLYLARLLAEPDREFHVSDLVRSVEAPPLESRRARLEAADRTERTPTGPDAPRLDPRARTEYRRRLEALRAELADAEARNDPGRIERARTELAWIESELGAAFGLSDRTRSVPSVERARKAVYARIRATIRRIGSEHPLLGRHLEASIQTGVYCVYRPERSVSWEIG